MNRATLIHLNSKLEGLIEFRSRWIKEIAAGRLSKSNIQRAAQNLPGERLVKRLGSGGTQNADLVVRGKHGLMVRKSARDGIQNRSEMAESSRQMMRLQRGYSGPSGFAQVKKVGPSGLSYHEYVPGATAMSGKTRTERFLSDETEKLNHKLVNGIVKRTPFIPTPRDIARRELEIARRGKDYWIGEPPDGRHMKREKLASLARRLHHRELPPSKSQADFIRYADEKGIEISDLTRRNRVGGKFVDYEAEPQTGGWRHVIHDGETKAYDVFRRRAAKLKHLKNRQP